MKFPTNNLSARHKSTFETVQNPFNEVKDKLGRERNENNEAKIKQAKH